MIGILVFWSVLAASVLFEASIAYILLKIDRKFNSTFSLIGAALAVLSLVLFVPYLNAVAMWNVTKYFQSIGVALNLGHGEALVFIERIGYLETLLVFIVFLNFLIKGRRKGTEADGPLQT